MSDEVAGISMRNTFKVVLNAPVRPARKQSLASPLSLPCYAKVPKLSRRQSFIRQPSLLIRRVEDSRSVAYPKIVPLLIRNSGDRSLEEEL